MSELDLERIRADADDAAGRRIVADNILPTLTHLVTEDVQAMADEIVRLTAEAEAGWKDATELRKERENLRKVQQYLTEECVALTKTARALRVQLANARREAA